MSTSPPPAKPWRGSRVFARSRSRKARQARARPPAPGVFPRRQQRDRVARRPAGHSGPALSNVQAAPEGRTAEARQEKKRIEGSGGDYGSGRGPRASKASLTETSATHEM